MFAAIVINEDLIDLGLIGKEIERSNANEEGDGRVGEMATEWTNHRCRENSIANEAKTEDENSSDWGLKLRGEVHAVTRYLDVLQRRGIDTDSASPRLP